MPRRPPLRGTAALERLAEVVDQLAGVPIPASVLERDVLPARVPGYQPRLLDELGALGEVAWVGRGSLGRDDGRIVLFRPGREALPTCSGQPDGRAARRTRATTRSASTSPRAARRSTASLRGRGRRLGPRGPRRAVGPGLGGRGHERHVRAAARPALEAAGWQRRPAAAAPRRLTASDRPRRPAAGRSSRPGDADRAASTTERLHAQALALLERHGVLTREAVAAEGIEGGFCGRLPGPAGDGGGRRIRRGYFVDGLGAAQFALPGALDRLRAVREPAEPAATGAVHLLAAADPANPYGAALPWPRRGETDRRPLQRAAGAYVVLVDGVAALYLERGGATLQTLPAADDPGRGGRRCPALRALVGDGRIRELVIRKVDGEEVGGSRSARPCSRPASSRAIAGSRSAPIGR